jgi:hypothetical protein
VRGFRNHHDIAVHRDSESAERGEITLDAAAQIIGVAKMTALRMIRRGELKGWQAPRMRPGSSRRRMWLHLAPGADQQVR